MAAASLASIMRDQVALSVTCLDRLYLNGYVPTLQAPGQLVRFCREHLGKPIASPALFGPLHDRFVQSVQTFAVKHDVPLVHFRRGQRKDTLAAQYRAHSKVDDGVVFIGIAQEKATSFKARKVVVDLLLGNDRAQLAEVEAAECPGLRHRLAGCALVTEAAVVQASAATSSSGTDST